AGVPAQQRGQLAEAHRIQFQVEVDTVWIAIPAATDHERAQPLCGAVGTRRHRRAVDFPGAQSGRCEVEVGIGQIEDRFGFAEFEIHAAVAYMDCWNRPHHRRAYQRSEIPAAGLGPRTCFGEIDAGAIQPDRPDDELPHQQRPDPWRYFQAARLLYVDDRLKTDGRVLVNSDAAHREARSAPQAELHFAELDLPAERAFERP